MGQDTCPNGEFFLKKIDKGNLSKFWFYTVYNGIDGNPCPPVCPTDPSTCGEGMMLCYPKDSNGCEMAQTCHKIEGNHINPLTYLWTFYLTICFRGLPCYASIIWIDQNHPTERKRPLPTYLNCTVFVHLTIKASIHKIRVPFIMGIISRDLCFGLKTALVARKSC